MNAEDFYNLTFVLLCVIITVGIVGNIISIFVWAKGAQCREMTCYTYFKILTVCDLFVLLVPGTNSLLKYIPGNSIHLLTTNDFLCKFVIFTVQFSLQLAEQVTVAVIVDCTIALCFPVHFYRRNNKVRCAYLVFVFLTLVLMVLNIPVSLAAELETVKNRGKTLHFCSIPKEPKYTLISPYTYLSSIVYIVFPTFMFIVCDLIALVRFFRIRNSTPVHRILTRNITKMAKLAMCINVVHVITNIPVLLTFLIRFDLTDLDSDVLDLRILSVVSYVCLYSRHAINILFYCIVKKDFRHDLSMFCLSNSICRGETCRENNGTEVQSSALVLNMPGGIKLDFQNRDSFWV